MSSTDASVSREMSRGREEEDTACEEGVMEAGRSEEVVESEVEREACSCAE